MTDKTEKIGRPNSPAFRAALKAAEVDPQNPQPKCAGKPAEYMDYDTPPSPAEAKALCADCPLLILCGKSASYARPVWGIHGGVAWADGRRAKNLPDNP